MSADNQTPTLGRHMSIDISVKCWADILANMSTDTSWSIYWPSVDRYVERHIYRPSVDRYVEQHIGRVSVDISADTSVDYQSICQPITWARGAQNTHDPS